MIENIIKGLKIIFVLAIVITIVIALFMTFFVIIPIEGRSMLPTVEDADNVLVLKLVDIARGDVVVFEGSNGEGRLIKRVIAIEGDSVELKENSQGILKFFVNDIELKEEYVYNDMYISPQHIPHKAVVPKGCFYYLGDNRIVSKDSSHLSINGNPQFAKIADIVGKVVLRYNINQWEVALVG